MNNEILRQYAEAKGFIFTNDSCDFGRYFPIQGNQQLYYQIGKGTDWRLEFWVCTNRNDAQEQLNNLFTDEKIVRNYWHGRYYSSRGICSRNPVIDGDTFATDFEILGELLKPVINTQVQNSGYGEKPSIGIQCQIVADILKKELYIPNYQRSYCWEKKNILGLLNGIAKWQTNHKGELYHIGTIVLKENQSGNYDVIDGQQRLITLGLFSACKSKIIPKINLGQNNTTNIAKFYLQQAKDEISNWKGEIELENLCMSVITISKDESEDLAFLFFSHLNSSGKKLNDYDLLKSHHLRYLENDIAGLMAKKWNDWDNDEEKHEQLRTMLHIILYRLRNWLDRKDFPYSADELDSHDLFKHFTLDYEPMVGLCTPYQPYQLNSILANGLEFFNYVEQYKLRLQEFCTIECVKLLEPLRWHSYGTLYFSIYALAFFFYRKFGDFYLKEAIYSITYKVSVLRNETQLRRDYIAKQSVFYDLASLIDKATHEGEFFGKILDENEMYAVTNTSKTANAYWYELKTLFKKLETTHIKGHINKLPDAIRPTESNQQ